MIQSEGSVPEFLSCKVCLMASFRFGISTIGTQLHWGVELASTIALKHRPMYTFSSYSEWDLWGRVPVFWTDLVRHKSCRCRNHPPLNVAVMQSLSLIYIYIYIYQGGPGAHVVFSIAASHINICSHFHAYLCMLVCCLLNQRLLSPRMLLMLRLLFLVSSFFFSLKFLKH